MLKAAVAVGSQSGTWGGELSPLSAIANQFLLSLRSLSVFDAMLPFSPEVPFRTKVAVTASGATGSSVNEGMVKPISKLSLTAVDIDEQKVNAVVESGGNLVQEGPNGVAIRLVAG